MKESSEVLARKYRPINFDELIGQETISQTLSLALDSNRLSHAYLFSGLRGSGKTSTARIFAKALICEQGMSHQPCGNCQNCTLALENRHMDIVEMDAASSRKIDDIRDLIEQTKYRPATARYKIFIIDEVHMLTKEAFNALLKTLEEPPEYVKFILATTDPLKLPATILSRTQHFRFKSIATNKIIDHLAHILNLEGIKYEADALEILARSGSGSLRDTLTLLDQAIIYSKNHVDVRTVTDMLGLVDPAFIGELFSAVFAKDYARLVELIKVLEDYEAEMVVDELIAYLKEKMYASDALYSTLVLDRFFRILSDSKYLFSINADGSFVLSLIFFKMIEALRIKEVDQMIESLQKEIHRPPVVQSMTEPTQSATTQESVKIPMQDETPIIHVNPDSSSESNQDTEVNRLEESKPKVNEKFEELINKIKDRNFELGQCFDKSISFISYENSVLTWESCADEDCKKTLTHGYSAIKQLVREVFGFETKIKHQACTKTDEFQEPHEEKETHIQQPTMQHTQSTSMVEDAEIGGSASCVTNCQSSEESTKEIDGVEIKNEPMVQKAVELFEAKKMTIQSKI
ncbi:DNA polymerase III subunit gamma/tau [Sulfurimonas sp.]|uniref:DNA polymerase III subunit gamma/tau n=1 Tax=Sulfurimonas sp. TaxID=2022749 RepID=UPI0026242B5B|nr:DNA polymerase III subunit gamma/tau [Sulfurimonas sp.]MCW8895934.1 DNA polymerase III subunit gamma/tau [Sulfurimonas sp.]MCW9067425.1 DNA polymerase III subunit gamma/tau [Sulfurimonas sp.]